MNRLLSLHVAILLSALLALGCGFVLSMAGHAQLAAYAWVAGSVPALVWLILDLARTLMRGSAGIDILALISIGGAIALHESLTGNVIAVMLASGQLLESYAQFRAGREMTMLLARAPRHAMRLQQGELVRIDLDQVVPGDRLLVRSGDTVPVDGLLTSVDATLDESALSGESAVVERHAGDRLHSGAINAATAFEMTATTSAADSTFAGIVRLVEQARSSRAPASRLADRYALGFVPLALGLAGLAWLVSGDPLRALAVVVVATPCPLILAVPVAIVSGMSRAAQRGILVKGAAALEMLARASILFFDKTGTLTSGNARLVKIVAAPGIDRNEVLRLAASVDQVSAHVTAAAIVSVAHARRLVLELPTDGIETPGAGVEAHIGEHAFRVGTAQFVATGHALNAWAQRLLDEVGSEGGSAVLVSRDGALIGALHLADQIRIETPHAVRLLRQAGISRMIMLTGDRPDVAETIGMAVGVDEICAGLDPQEKLLHIAQAKSSGISIMVGDGVNDAPALAAADVGVAMGAHGAAASSEAADVVLLVDRLDRLAEAIQFARATREIAVQSVLVGMGLSIIAMLAAAIGWLAPLPGATLQELIDVAAILNALRALRIAPLHASLVRLNPVESRRLLAEHAALVPLLDMLDHLADQLPALPHDQALEELAALHSALQQQLLAHERADDNHLYPKMTPLLGGNDPLAAMSRTHREIFALAHRLERITASLHPDRVTLDDLHEIQRLLYALGAIVRLHFAQEDELFFTLAD